MNNAEQFCLRAFDLILFLVLSGWYDLGTQFLK